MDKLQDSIGDYRAFLGNILQEITDAGFALADFVQMDHMAYRVPTLERYEQKKRELAAAAALLGETQVNGRPIAVFRLREPVRFDTWRIDAIELPAPKAGTAPAEGLEHVELVLYDDKDSFLKKYADKQFELKAAERGINPEIGFALPHYGVKFHLLNLPTVVYLEHKLELLEKHNGQ
jgi:predicted metalloenzyme YecM